MTNQTQGNGLQLKTNAGHDTTNDIKYLSAPDMKFEYEDNKQQHAEKESLSAWVTLVSVFLVSIIIGYHNLTFSVYYIVFSEVFDSSKALTGTVGSLHSFLAGFQGLFASTVIKQWGCKPCAIFGCLLGSTGLLLASFGRHLYHIHATYSIMTGAGQACVFLPALTLIQTSFTRRRSMASAIAVCGIPLGNLLAPPITTLLVEHLGWRGTLMIHCGIFLNIFVCIMLWTESKPKKSAQNSQNTSTSFLRNCCDLSPLRNTTFIAYIVASSLIQFNVIVFFDQTVSRAVFYGSGRQLASLVLTTMCVCSLISRASIGVSLRFIELNPLGLATAIGVTQALMAFAVAASTTYMWTIGCTIGFGLAQGGLITQSILSTVKITGVENFARSRAVFQMTTSFMALLPTPLTGYVFDRTQNYNLPFVLSGCIGAIGSITMALVMVYVYRKDKAIRSQANTVKFQLSADLTDSEDQDNLPREERIRCSTL